MSRADSYVVVVDHSEGAGSAEAFGLYDAATARVVFSCLNENGYGEPIILRLQSLSPEDAQHTGKVVRS